MRNALNPDRSITSDRLWSSLMAEAAIARYTPAAAKWHYEHGLLLKAIEQVWHATGQIKYWHFIKDTLDPFVAADGSIRTYRPDEYNLDQINPGKMLLTLWQATGDERYRAAVRLLRQQLQHQPRTPSGGFWHKQI